PAGAVVRLGAALGLAATLSAADGRRHLAHDLAAGGDGHAGLSAGDSAGTGAGGGALVSGGPRTRLLHRGAGHAAAAATLVAVLRAGIAVPAISLDPGK